MLKKMKKVAAITTMLCLLGANTVLAVAPAPDAVVTGGELAITDLLIDDFATVQLDGTTQEITAALTTPLVNPWTLTDSTGTGAGWKVSLKASQFTLAAADFALVAADVVTAGAVDTLPLSSLALGTVSIADADIDKGSSAITGLVMSTEGDKIDTLVPVNILSAPLNGGMGTYTVSMTTPMTLTLSPAKTFKGTYTSTVTQTLTAGPVI